MKQRFLVFWILALNLPLARGDAQQIVDRSQVKENKEAIFNSPELRYLKNLRQPGRSWDSPFNRRGGNEGGGNNGEGQGDRNDGQRHNRNDPQNVRRNDANDEQNARPPRNNRREFDPDAGNRRSMESPFGGGSFGAGAAGLFQFLGYLAIAAMIVAIIVLIARSIQDRERNLESEFAAGEGMELGELEPEQPPGLTPSAEFVRRARELARRGEFREAVALLVLGAMSEVERRGLIRYRRGLTQRDYFRALRGHQEMAASYRQMVRIYEPLGFGRRTATAQHFQETLHQFEAGFRERETISEN